MISVSSSGASFRGLAAYLRLGRSGEELGRVAWSAERNLPTDDIELAGKIMRETAAQNRRVQEPVYHFVLSFDRRDAVSRSDMERIVDRVLAAHKLSEHQALLVAHKDRSHAHIHVMVNRVHPDTLRAWDRWHDMVVTQRVLREEERNLGLRVIPGRLTPVVGRSPAIEAELAASLRLSDTRPRADVSLLERARERLSDWRRATSWADLAKRLDVAGLWVEARERGAVVTDGERHVRASQVAPDCSGPALAKRFGEPVPRAPTPDHGRIMEVRDAVTKHGQALAADRAAAEAETALAGARHWFNVLDAALTRADGAWQDFDRALRQVWPDVTDREKVRAAFARISTHSSPSAAREAFRATLEPVTEQRGWRSLGSIVFPATESTTRNVASAIVEAGSRALDAERDS